MKLQQSLEANLDQSLVSKLLYTREEACLHLEGYRIMIKSSHVVVCGPCFFRDGYETEVPTRINRARVVAPGSKDYDPYFINHLGVSVGLVPPLPGQSLREFRSKRLVRSQPSPKQHPVTTTLWNLMGRQPPLAVPLVKFCEGYNEVQIADEMGTSIWNIVERLRKAVHTGQKMLRV